MARIAAKATRGKGKKLSKGQSCVSNPVTRKHRDKVAGLLSDNPSTSTSSLFSSKLTRDNLQKFDAIQSQKQRNEVQESVEEWLQDKNNENGNNKDNCDGEINQHNDVFSIGNISAASIWSNVTNVSFDKFLNGFDPKSKIHKSMLTVLATIRDAIDQQKGTETETEYFSGLMLALNCVDSEEKLTATLALLQMVLKRVPQPILRLKFSETSSTLMKILSQQINSDLNSNGYLTKSIINSLHTLLINQELAVWQLNSTKQIFDTILLLIFHPKPRIRKTATFSVISLVCNKDQMNENTNSGTVVASKLTAEFCISKLEEYLTSQDENFNIILYIFSLLSDTMTYFPSVSYTKRILETVLSHMASGNVLLVTGALQTFYSFFIRRPQSNILSPEMNARLLNALYDYQPNINDDQPLNAWFLVLKEVLLSLHNLDSNLFFLHIPKFIKTAINCLHNDSSVVKSNICQIIKCAMMTVINEQSKISNDLLINLYSELETCLKYQYGPAWVHIIPIYSELFFDNKMLQEKFGAIMQRMVIIYESNDAKVNAAIEKFFGKVIRNFGPRFVLNYCPINWETLNTSRHNDDDLQGQFTNPWLLPVLRQNLVNNCELALFLEHFLPIADKLTKKISFLEQSISENMELNDSDQPNESCLFIIKELKRCVHAVWSLLPKFCKNPIDIQKDFFSKLARRMGQTLYSKELAIYPLTALRNLLKSNEIVQKEVGRFSKNFLPILFNVYTNENESTQIIQELRFSVLVLIQQFILAIFFEDSPTSLQVFRTFYDKILSYLNENGCTTFRKHALLDILRAFLHSPKGFQLEDIKFICLEIAQPIIQDCQSPTEQKKGFRLIEEIIMNKSVVCEQFLIDHLKPIMEYLFSLFNEPKLIKSPSTRGFALRIIHQLIRKFVLIEESGFLNTILPLILSNLVIKSKKTKKYARKILIVLSDSYNHECNKLPKIISLMIDALKQNPNMDNLEKTSRLNAIAFLYINKYYYPVISRKVISEIADVIISCLNNVEQSPPTRPILNICLEFIKHFLHNTPVDLLNSYLEVITCGITNLPVEHRTKYHGTIKLLLTKLARKFGNELIYGMISEDYKKVMKNIKKLEDRKKKIKDKESFINYADYTDQSDIKSTLSHKSQFGNGNSDDEENDIEKFINNETWDDDEQSTKKSFQSKSQYEINSILSNISTKKFIREEIDGDPIDLLSSNINQVVVSEIPKKYHEKNEGIFGEGSSKAIPISEDGRLNVGELIDQLEAPKKGQKRLREENEDNSDDDDDEDDVTTNFENNTYQTGGKGIHRSLSNNVPRSVISKDSSIRSKNSGKSNKNSESILRGDIYKSKKGLGDIKRKGMLDPYAYYPLNTLKRNKRKGELKEIIKGAKKGAFKELKKTKFN